MHKINLTILNFRFQDKEGVKAVEGLGVHNEDKRNTIYTWGRGSQMETIRNQG